MKQNIMNKNLNIALLLGGISPEREVSKSSSASIYKSLQNLGYNVVLIDPAYGCHQPESPDKFFLPDNRSDFQTRNYIDAVNSSLLDNIDLAFLGLHGKFGEDGYIQSLLELRKIPYTGSGHLSSAMAMDKSASKILFKHFNINTADWLTADKSSYNTDSILNSLANSFGYPCVIKPNDQGSTVGLSVCENFNQIQKALKKAFKFSDKALIEKYIPGRELTVAILDNQPLPVLEIVPKHGLYDYECKYTSGMSSYICPADLPKQIVANLQNAAVKAFEALNCKTYGRVDFRLSPDNEYFCLEVNTLPGMTSTSLVPKMAKAVGISFDELVDKIVKLSLQK